ncbi:MAG: sensor histidine kinase, partial [Alphaproteobacteria bacterium]
MNMPHHPAIVRASVASDGRLLGADAPLLALQEEAGGSLGTLLVIPQLTAIARLTQRLGVPVSRPVAAAAERGDIDMWVRAKPDGACVSLSIIDWQERPIPLAPVEQIDREADIATLAEGWTWQVD